MEWNNTPTLRPSPHLRTRHHTTTLLVLLTATSPAALACLPAAFRLSRARTPVTVLPSSPLGPRSRTQTQHSRERSTRCLRALPSEGGVLDESARRHGTTLCDPARSPRHAVLARALRLNTTTSRRSPSPTIGLCCHCYAPI
ncbi:hypothetical protein ACCO45_006375 [Purpureocillium lilacinum]|uniref:Uncharacterized protein n=1 Tax=Purpureocillium lilacinum TaxID=33203 RepID=A0ACC4DQ10_PURLI